MPAQYYPVIIIFAVAVAIVVAFLAGATFLGPYRPTKLKGRPFECGLPSSGTERHMFSVKFYVVAITFIVFDIEIAFLYPWAVVFKELGWFGFAEMMIFLFVLVVALAYEWKRGALEWED